MFCKYCGKQIPDGEVCFCEKAVAQRAETTQNNAAGGAPAAAPAAPAASVDVGAILGKILGSFKALFKNANYIGSDLTTPVTFAVTGLLLHILSWLCLKGMLLGDLPIKLEGLTGTLVWCGCLSYLVPLACFILIPVIGSLVHKEAVNLRKAFACAAAVSVVPSAMFLLGGLVGLVISEVGTIIIVAAIVAGINACTKLAGKLVCGNSALSVALVALVVAAMVGLTAYVEISVIKEFITKLLSSLMDSVMGGLSGLGGIFG